MNPAKKSVVPLFCVCCLAAALLAGCGRPGGDASASTVQGAAQPAGSSAQSSADVPLPTIEGKVDGLSQEDVAAVDQVLNDWVAAQGAHEKGSSLNEDMSIAECKILRWGSEADGAAYEAWTEGDIYYILNGEDGQTYRAYEYIYLEKQSGAWEIVSHDLMIGGYDGPNGWPLEKDPDDRFTAPFRPDTDLFETPFQTQEK